MPTNEMPGKGEFLNGCPFVNQFPIKCNGRQSVGISYLLSTKVYTSLTLNKLTVKSEPCYLFAKPCLS